MYIYMYMYLLHNECCDAMLFCLRVCLGIEHHHISIWAIGDPELVPVQNIVVTCRPAAREAHTHTTHTHIHATYMYMYMYVVTYMYLMLKLSNPVHQGRDAICLV